MRMLQPLTGIVLIYLLCWLSSSKRNHFSIKTAAAGLGLQVVLAFGLLKLPMLQDLLLVLNSALVGIEQAAQAGTSMVFGFLGGGDAPFDITSPQNSFILAFRALPIVIVFSSLTAVLWYWGITPLIIRGFAALLQRTLGIGGAVGLGSAASIFVGMIEAPLVIRPYIAKLTNSELFVLMTCGMATVAGTVLGLYAAILSPVLPGALSHIVVASVISAPAAITLALLMRPNSDATTVQPLPALTDKRYRSTMHAITTGTTDGLSLFLNIVAMLIVFVALVSIVDQLLALIPFTDTPVTLVSLLGWLLQPLMWSIGIAWEETVVAGELMATKIVLNELVAYIQLGGLPAESLSDKSRIIMTYALCGFANFGSLGIMIGGMTTMCPERTTDILRLSPLAIWSGVLATCMTGAVVGLII